MADPNDPTLDISIHSASDDTESLDLVLDGGIYKVPVLATLPSPNTGKFVSVFLENVGSRDMTVNGSATPVVFSRGPGTGKRWFVHRMIVFMRDNAMNWTKFGGLSVLTNGCDADYDSGGTNYDLLDGFIWRRNSDMVGYCYDAEINSATNDILRMRWTFARAGTALQLNNADGDLFRVTVNDDLTGLGSFRTIIQGYEVDE